MSLVEWINNLLSILPYSVQIIEHKSRLDLALNNGQASLIIANQSGFVARGPFHDTFESA